MVDRKRRTKEDFRLRDTRLCFTLPATLGDRGSEQPYERLKTPDDLGRWCVEIGLFDHPPAADEQKLSKAIALREAIQRVGEAIARRTPPTARDVAQINVAASVDVAPQLSDDAAAIRWVAGGIEGALSHVARDAIDLYAGKLRQRIRICENVECAGLFVDESRPGKRRWCSMTTCGDQAKKARIRLRKIG
ncbi:ABATE domain-containing protein [Ensifer adhaerens]|uniref:CGNR zinc finger domain-containing protein n=1 Tax=Ensifer adhaerens TaxID=106592 RepID=UPI001CBFA75A|nr:ABATE domain-containing protein [Ensifer adhaerens]MBZ7924836.1 ABATE domain-containing protein [Ensifer adhaerens]UAX95946.1 ABATE domain-containing protein [Ensifer adhaerens]UAY04712.1 ABATE domain-containing protein [Ensifer adhaerens]UAY10143.1 ABATE domain-containing protein [Ensifer adhaerens]